MLVVAVNLTLNPDLGCIEPRGPCRWPVAVCPAAVNLGLEEGRQETGEGPIKTVVGGFASFDRTVQG